MSKTALDLQFFTEAPAGDSASTGAAAAGIPEAGGVQAADIGTGDVNAGDTMADGRQVPDAQVAAALNRQMRRHPELRNAYFGQKPTAGQEPVTGKPGPAAGVRAEGEAAGAEQKPENDLEARWAELKKGEFKDLYGRDMRDGIRERFKNQEDANKKLTAMQPMLEALMKKAGVESVDELQKLVLNDDSLYEEEAEAKGMTVEAYKEFKALQDERDAAAARERRSQEQAQINQHIRGLMQQGEDLKQTFPQFDFAKEMQNEEFRQMTAPKEYGGAGLSVKQAYFAAHMDELVPQLIGYGMQRTQQQLGQTIKAHGRRPVEGASRGQGQAEVRHDLNFNSLNRKERDAIRRQIMDRNLVIPTR